MKKLIGMNEEDGRKLRISSDGFTREEIAVVGACGEKGRREPSEQVLRVSD